MLYPFPSSADRPLQPIQQNKTIGHTTVVTLFGDKKGNHYNTVGTSNSPVVVLSHIPCPVRPFRHFHLLKRY